MNQNLKKAYNTAAVIHKMKQLSIISHDNHQKLNEKLSEYSEKPMEICLNSLNKKLYDIELPSDYNDNKTHHFNNNDDKSLMDFSSNKNLKTSNMTSNLLNNFQVETTSHIDNNHNDNINSINNAKIFNLRNDKRIIMKTQSDNSMSH